MKKILIINTTLNKGGVARVANDIFENLNSNFDIFFAYGRGSKNTNIKTFYFGNKLEMLIHIFLVRFLGLEGFGSYFSTKKLIRFIEKEKFDLINLHNLHGYYVNFFTLLEFLKKTNIPVIYSLHDEWPITWMPAHSLGCNHCKTGVGICQNNYSYPKNYFPIFQKFMLKQKNIAFSNIQNMTITCPSVWLQTSIKNSFLGKFKVDVVANGVDIDIFRPVHDKYVLRIKHRLPLDKKIILFSASNLKDKSKGIAHIIEASKLLKDKKYLFLGLGNGKLKETNSMKTTGYIYDKKELAEMYALSDMFCFASVAETFLLSAAESLSCGVPVVGYDLPVVRELVNNDVGVLTKSNSLDLAESINALMEDEATRLKMGQSGRKLIEKNYSKEIFFTNYTNLYDEALNKKND